MLADQFDKLEQTLEAGCQKHLEAGGTITYGCFTDHEEGYDPIWASIDRDEAEKLETDLMSRAHFGLVKALGFKISVLDMLSFVAGYNEMKNSGGDKMCHELGQKFRAKYIVEENDDGNDHNEKGSDDNGNNQ